MILLTGATGLAGSFITDEFVRERVPVRILVRNRAKAKGFERAPTVRIVEGDIETEQLGIGPRRRRSSPNDLSPPHGYGGNAKHVYRRGQGGRRSPRDQILWFGRSARHHVPIWPDAQGH